METEKIPETLDEAIDLIIDMKIDINNISEEEFISSAHNSIGNMLRNKWFLWWFPNHTYKWPKEEPELKKWFRSIDIIHADDISSIILTCYYRDFHCLPRNLEDQVAKYKKFWKEQGFKNGIPDV